MFVVHDVPRNTFRSITGSNNIDLFKVRRGGNLNAWGGGGNDLYYTNSRTSKIKIFDFSQGDCLKLNAFNQRDLRNGTLKIEQDGDAARFRHHERTVATLTNIDKNDLFFTNGCFMLNNSDPLLA